MAYSRSKERPLSPRYALAIRHELFVFLARWAAGRGHTT